MVRRARGATAAGRREVRAGVLAERKATPRRQGSLELWQICTQVNVIRERFMHRLQSVGAGLWDCAGWRMSSDARKFAAQVLRLP